MMTCARAGRAAAEKKERKRERGAFLMNSSMMNASARALTSAFGHRTDKSFGVHICSRVCVRKRVVHCARLLAT